MIVITGVNGFIGGNFLKHLNKKNINNAIIIDNNNTYINQYKYYKFQSIYDTLNFNKDIECIIHIGAISNTLEKNYNKICKYNIDYTKKLYDNAKKYNIPFIFTSTAAIYGNDGYPLNIYAESKLVCENYIKDDAMILRLFNVYGPGEENKGRMASTIYQWYNQLKHKSHIEIFKNSSNYYRDFIYIQDICDIIYFFMKNNIPGVYDIGSGDQFNFEYVADNVIKSFGRGYKKYVDMPGDLKKQYQISTKANIIPLKNAGYSNSFIKLNDGIKNYIGILNS